MKCIIVYKDNNMKALIMTFVPSSAIQNLNELELIRFFNTLRRST
jgi:hypothetical protein